MQAMSEKHKELWEDRFEIYCEKDIPGVEEYTDLYNFVREAFKDGYAWGLTDEHQKTMSERKENDA